MNIHLRFCKHCWQYSILVTLHERARSTRSEVFCKRCFRKFRKPKVFSCEFSEIFNNTFFHRTPPVAASEKLKAEAVVQRCSVKEVFLEILLNSQETLVPESSNIHEIMKTNLNSFIQKLHNHKKAQNANKLIKIKNAPKKHLRGK